MVVNDQNQITEAIAYQPYGTIVPLEDIASSPQTPTRQQFTGKEFDQEGGTGVGISGMDLYYFGKRYYNPELGVWISTDPKEQMFNPYAYSPDPLNTIDPDGQWIGSLLAAATWYITAVISNYGEFNPGKWNWDDPGLVMSTFFTLFSIGADIGNDIKSFTKKHFSFGAQEAGSEKPFVSENDWMKKFSTENQKRILKYADETYNESLKGSLNNGKSYEARRWLYHDEKGNIQAGNLQKPPSGENPLKFSIAYEKTPDPNWKRLGLIHGHYDKNLSVKISCCRDGTDIPYFRDVIIPKYELGNGAIFAVSEKYLTGRSPKYGYSYLHR
jgi:RHS repeat-associated protein